MQGHLPQVHHLFPAICSSTAVKLHPLTRVDGGTGASSTSRKHPRPPIVTKTKASSAMVRGVPPLEGHRAFPAEPRQFFPMLP
jgi:hypothetical protein